MNPRDSESVFVVRVDKHAAIVADVDLVSRRVRRALRYPGGLRAIDGLIESIVVAAAADELGDVDSGTDVVWGASDRDRLRREVAAARIRLVGEESTTVAVRRGRRTVFVPVERDAVLAVLASGTAAVARGVTTLGATPDSFVVRLDGVDAVPGLPEALPGQEMQPALSESYDLGILLDSASAVEPSAPTPPRTPRHMAVLRRAWPGAVAVVLLLAVGGTAAAVTLGGHSAGGRPAPTTTPRTDESIENAADRSATPTPTPTVTQPAAIVPTAAATPAAPKAPAQRTTKSGPSNPGTGSGAVVPADPVSPATTPPDPPHTDPPSSDPTPSDPPPTDPGALG